MKNFSKILTLPIVAISGSILLTNNANAAISETEITKICSIPDYTFWAIYISKTDDFFELSGVGSAGATRNTSLLKNGNPILENKVLANYDVEWEKDEYHLFLSDGKAIVMEMERRDDGGYENKGWHINNAKIEQGWEYEVIGETGSIGWPDTLILKKNGIELPREEAISEQIWFNWDENIFTRTINNKTYTFTRDESKKELTISSEGVNLYDFKYDWDFDNGDYFIFTISDNYTYFYRADRQINVKPADIFRNGKPLCEKPTIPTSHPLEEKITNLPALDAVTLEDETKINDIKKEFDALSQEDKKKISDTNTKKLQDLLNKITELKKKKDENKLNTSSNSGASTSGSGGGGGSSSSSIIPFSSNISTPIHTLNNNINKDISKTETSHKIFPNFTPKKVQAVSDLSDAKLSDLNKKFGIINEKTRNEALTRGEFLKIVLDSANINVKQNSTEKLTFSDIGKNTEIAKYIAFARENNIISGYEDNTFRANATISRAEATKILMESLGVKIAEKNTTFSDIKTDNTLGKYIQTAYDNFIINGTSKNTFEPNRSISRGELIKIIYNILN